jgi:hypothetical protein
MNPVVGVWLLLGLVIALVLAHRAVRLRRKREMQQRRRPSMPRPARLTDRAEMRANDDPSTFAHNTTTHSRDSDIGMSHTKPPTKD